MSIYFIKNLVIGHAWYHVSDLKATELYEALRRYGVGEEFFIGPDNEGFLEYERKFEIGIVFFGASRPNSRGWSRQVAQKSVNLGSFFASMTFNRAAPMSATNDALP